MGSVVSDLLKDVKIPRMVKVRQIFSDNSIAPEAIPSVIHGLLTEKKFKSQIQPGMRVAITAGSRGVANVAIITRAIADYVKAQGGEPFIIPAMGSHGGATAEGQRQILKDYGITEETMDCPVLSSMETVKIGLTEDGRDVRIDKYASEADGIIIACRIKPHTAFRGPYESGIMKMMAIGLAKQEGAEVCHDAGFKNMAVNVPKFGRAILKHAKILFSVATIENAYDKTAKLVALAKDEIDEQEPGLLQEAFSMMPKILVDSCDVLVVDQIGKNFSGGGMDPNVSGTFVTQYASGGIKSQHVAVLDVSDESHGNAVGVGTANATTRRLFNKADFDQMYPNSITSTVLNSSRIPCVMDNDKLAIQICIRASTEIDRDNVRLVRIANTLHIEHIYLSEAYLDEIKGNDRLIIESEPEEMAFDENGNLF